VSVQRDVSSTLAEPLTVDAAAQYIHDSALTETRVGAVGLELETHLVDLAAVTERVGWDRVTAAVAALPQLRGRSVVTLEPGGQVEFSGPPAPDVLAAIAAVRQDVQTARLALAERRLGLAHLGADPLRPSRRVNPRPRYQAMQRHFEATGQASAGLAMMCSTAAVQVNLQAGPAASWHSRVGLAHRLGPTLIAIAASSPWLAGRDERWKSARQRVWSDLDARRCGPLLGRADPAQEWTRYALQAPVMFVQTDADEAVPVRGTVAFGDWLSGAARLGGRRPSLDDLRTHLTTLFPPVRLRGFLEIRYLDMSPPRWWPALVAVTAVLMDDPVAADQAADATEGTDRRWTEAARDGLADPGLGRAARRCLEIAADRVPAELAPAVADLAELVASGRCPGDLVAERLDEVGPSAVLAELAHA